MLLWLFLLACDDGETDIVESIEIGAVLSETGPTALEGISLIRGAQLAVDQVNDAGGLLDRPVELINEDDVGDPARSAQAARSHVDADRAGFVGAVDTATSLSAADVAVGSEIVMMNPTVEDADFALDDNAYVIRTIAPEDSEGVVAAARLDQTGSVTVAVLRPAESVIADRAARAMEDRGLTLAAEVVYDTDMDAALTTLDTDAPDAGVYFVGTPADGMALAAALEGWPDAQWRWLLSASLDDDAFAPTAFPDHEGLRPRDDGPGFFAFQTAFEARYGGAPTVGQARTYDAAILLMLGIVTAGNERGDAVRDRALLAGRGGARLGPSDLEFLFSEAANGVDVDYEGAASPVDLDADGDTVGWFDIWELDGATRTVTVPGFRP